MKKGLSVYFNKKSIAAATAIIATASALIYANIDREVIQSRDLYRQKTSTPEQIQVIASTVSPQELLAVYPQYWAALKAAETGDDLIAGAFLRQQKEDSYLTERVRNTWLKTLGKNQNWVLFSEQYPLLNPLGIEQETTCYNEIYLFSKGQIGSTLAVSLSKSDQNLSVGCNQMLNIAAQNGSITEDQAWVRVRTLLGNNQTTAARNLAAALGKPLPSQLGSSTGDGSKASLEGALYGVTSPSARKAGTAVSRLNALSPYLSSEQQGFAWGKIALDEAKNLNMGTALNYFDRADPNQLSNEQWEWWARAALRTQNWAQVEKIITKMPSDLQQDPTWQYWLARSLSVRGNQASAKQIWQKTSESGRNFYAALSTEELGGRINANNNVKKSSHSEINHVAKLSGIKRALALYDISVREGRAELREDARREWRFAVRELPEDKLLATSELALSHGFLEMAIYSADRTNEKLNYDLRYLSPHKDTTIKYSKEAGVDPAWVYGLIRQESRFIIAARSTVGASGLMQLMPATAKWVAGKMGINGYRIDDIDTNIQMGTWYLGYVEDTLGHEVLATAGYNAGPGRAKNWKGYSPLEGAIYAETIPFNETRDYVKKVMTNAVYYAVLFGEDGTSLKQRMGTIPSK